MKKLSQTDSDAIIENTYQLTYMMSEVSDFSFWLIQDTFFFDGKEKVYEALDTYKGTIDIELKECIQFKPYLSHQKELLEAYQKIQAVHLALNVELNAYITEVKSKSLSIFNDRISVCEIEENMNMMQEKQIAWCKVLQGDDKISTPR